MIQTLKKYRFFALMLPPALIMFADLLLGVELPSLVNFFGSCFFILACISVPADFGKEKNQPQVPIETKDTHYLTGVLLMMCYVLEFKNTIGRNYPYEVLACPFRVLVSLDLCRGFG